MTNGSGPTMVQSALEMYMRRETLVARAEALSYELQGVQGELAELDNGWAPIRDGLSVDHLLTAMCDLVAENNALKSRIESRASVVASEPQADAGFSIAASSLVTASAPHASAASSAAPSDADRGPATTLDAAPGDAATPGDRVAASPGVAAPAPSPIVAETAPEKPKRGYYTDKQFMSGYRQGNIHRRANAKFEPGRGRGHIYHGYKAGYEDAANGIDDWEAAFRILNENAAKEKAGGIPTDAQIASVLEDDGSVGGIVFNPSSTLVEESGEAGVLDASEAASPLDGSISGSGDHSAQPVPESSGDGASDAGAAPPENAAPLHAEGTPAGAHPVGSEDAPADEAESDGSITDESLEEIWEDSVGAAGSESHPVVPGLHTPPF